jgi:hypothetical protein
MRWSSLTAAEASVRRRARLPHVGSRCSGTEYRVKSVTDHVEACGASEVIHTLATPHLDVSGRMYVRFMEIVTGGTATAMRRAVDALSAVPRELDSVRALDDSTLLALTRLAADEVRLAQLHVSLLAARSLDGLGTNWGTQVSPSAPVTAPPTSSCESPPALA